MIKKLFLNEKFILGLIFVNSVILFLGGYLPITETYVLFNVADNAITALFLVEMVFKIKEYRINGYFKSGWNKLDFLLVVLSIPALITFILNIDIFDFSYLLVFRILRVFKTFRFFKFIPNIGELVSGVQRALQASVFVFIGFVIYVFIIGILSFYLFRESESEYFRNPMISLYSIFKIFTVDGWSEIAEKVTVGSSQSIAFFTYVYFIFVVLTGGIMGLSLVNSIFVDSMMSDNNEDLENKIDDLNAKVSELIIKLNSHETRKDS